MAYGPPIKFDKPEGYIARRFRKEWHTKPELICEELGVPQGTTVYGNEIDLRRTLQETIERFRDVSKHDKLAVTLGKIHYQQFAPVLSYQIYPPKGWVWFRGEDLK